MVTGTSGPSPAEQCLHIHSPRPATEWSEAFPVGNGRLGAMVYGRTGTELLQLNEDSVWYGGLQDRTPQDAARHLPELRHLIRAGRHKEAEDLVRLAFFATPASMRHYEPAGSVEIEFGHGAVTGDDEETSKIQGYRRWLDLQTATVSTAYSFTDPKYGKVDVRRDVISSFRDGVILIRITASRKIRYIVRLNRKSEIEWETNEFLDSIKTNIGGGIIMHATPGGKDSNRLCVVLTARSDDLDRAGVDQIGNCLVVTATECTLSIAAETSYRHKNPENAARAAVRLAWEREWDFLQTEHVVDYRKLFDRVSLRMWPDASVTPTEERIKSHRDPGLVALYHNYGRYLLISCSRGGPKPLPATLQGIWNPSFAPPWGAKYTININLQMNYWPAAPCNLAECALPVVDLLERMAERGKVTARTMYECRGWCAHHNTDIWADTDPQDRWMPSTLWPLGGVWVCVDMVEMLKYHYDKGLHERLAPVLRGCVEFLLDFLVESECGRYLVTSPSLSPENTFISESGEPGIFCEGSVMDMTIVRWAFELFIWTADILKLDQALKEKVQDALARLPGLQINRDGLIQEWGLKDYSELEPGHRHISHLFGLYPGNFMRSGELRTAAKKVLERRAAHGGGHTGWSRAWLLGLHARLRDRVGCGKHMDLLLANSTLPNMLDNHPPFQIDGNFGACAGILECLIQSNESAEGVLIELLPSCPTEWSKGELGGVCVRGGWSVSFAWEDGRVIGPVVVRGTRGTKDVAVVIFPDERRVRVEGTGLHRVEQ